MDKHNPAIGEVFTQAGYFTGETLYRSEFSKDSNRLYERANQMRVGIKPDDLPSIYLRKRFNSSVDFVTSGNDYWFLKES